METKSRYEVVSDLEAKKRELIKERSGLKDTLLAKQKNLKNIERQKADTIVLIDRQIDDLKDDIANFEKTLTEREATINELIKSVDDSLGRFSKLTEYK
ncbi:MAG: hypothetical protein WC444_07000 [Candidatus Paceibacterota bacterium]